MQNFTCNTKNFKMRAEFGRKPIKVTKYENYMRKFFTGIEKKGSKVLHKQKKGCGKK